MPGLVLMDRLDDAYQFLCSAKGLPDTVNGRRQLELFLRASVVFSWMAVEECVKESLRAYEGQGYKGSIPSKLSGAICLSFALRSVTKQCVAGLPFISSKGELVERIRIALSDTAKIEGVLDHEKAAFDLQRFKRLRDLRNDLVHWNNGTTGPLLADVEDLYRFAKDLIERIENARVRHEFNSFPSMR